MNNKRRKKYVVRFQDRLNNYKSDRVMNLMFSSEKFAIPANWFDNLIDLSFESISFKAFSNYDEYLSGVYGDYMTPPPTKQRVSNHNFILEDKNVN